MENKRFFAFGCSFTEYAWPTWADILGRNYDEYYNYGQAGAGNMYIFNSIMEIDQYHKLTKDDLVIVQWSSTLREDRYKDTNWVTKGGILNIYTYEEFKKFFDFRGFLIRDLAAIKAIKVFLDSIGCEYYFIGMVPLLTSIEYEDAQKVDISDIYRVYADVLRVIKPTYDELLQTPKKRPKLLYNKTISDTHPVPSEHYEYLEAVLPHLLKEPKSVAIDMDKTLAEIWIDDQNYSWNYIWPDKSKSNNNKRTRL
jgi:hypothetical protein